MDWEDGAEVKQATNVLLPLWADMDTEDALELLNPEFDNEHVRQYAVSKLEKADDEVSFRIKIIFSTYTNASKKSVCNWSYDSFIICGFNLNLRLSSLGFTSLSLPVGPSLKGSAFNTTKYPDEISYCKSCEKRSIGTIFLLVSLAMNLVMLNL